MARRGNRQEIAKASVSVEVEGADKAKRDLRGVGDEAKATGGKMRGMGEGLDKSTEGARKLSGALSASVGIITSTIGAVVGLVAAIGLLVVALPKAVERWSGYSKALEDSRASQIEANRLLQEQIALAKELGAAGFAEILEANQRRLVALSEERRGLGGSFFGRALPRLIPGFGPILRRADEENLSEVQRLRAQQVAIRERLEGRRAAISAGETLGAIVPNRPIFEAEETRRFVASRAQQQAEASERALFSGAELRGFFEQQRQSEEQRAREREQRENAQIRALEAIQRAVETNRAGLR